MFKKGYTPWNKGKKYSTGKKTWICKVCPVCDNEFESWKCHYKKYCSSKCYGQTLIGKTVIRKYPKGFGKWNKGKKFPERSGKNNYNWRGDDAKYIAKHAWIYRQKGKPQLCEFCGEGDKRIEWANRDHEYSRLTEDYLSLCVSCHREYDYEYNDYKKRIIMKQ